VLQRENAEMRLQLDKFSEGMRLLIDLPTSAQIVTYTVLSGSLPAGLSFAAITGNQGTSQTPDHRRNLLIHSARRQF
jgi:hypothetical protein